VVLTNAQNCQGPILEVGCGPGMQSESIAKAFLNGEGRVLVSCDFSKAMVTRMKERYAQSSFGQQPGNKAVIDNETEYANPANTDRIDLNQAVLA